MKKIMIMVAGLVAAILVVGCGSDRNTETTKFTEEIHEEIITEEVIMENIITEEIVNENVYIDDEYTNEVNFNSRTNGW